MKPKSHVAVRLDEETLARVDAIRPLLDTKWREATRSDALRLLVVGGLELYEQEHQAELGAPRKRGQHGVKAPATPARRSRKKNALPAG